VTLTLLTPMRGWVASLEEVPDPVFAERMLGDGVAIDPTGGVLHAPCDAEVVSVARTGHAVTLRADNGAEILIHIGLETVALEGDGFTPHVNAGQRVKAGDLIVTFDLDLLGRRAKSLITPILVTNRDAFAITWRAMNREIEVGDRLMTLEPLVRGGQGETSTGKDLRTQIVLALPHGLHARPAGRITALVKPFAAEIAIAVHGRTANARSPVALMALGAAFGDDLTLSATGHDAAAALRALSAFLAGDGGETLAPVLNVVAPPVPAPSADGVLGGVTAAPGFAIGRAVQLRRAEVRVEEIGGSVDEERQNLTAALHSIRMRTVGVSGDSDAGGEVMAAHLAMLDDPDLVAAAEQVIATGKSAAYAWGRALDEQAEALRRLDDPRLRERAADLMDLKRQVLLALGGTAEAAMALPPDAILLADDLLPSELMAMGGRILGLCTAGGGPTSHVAIIAAALEVPAIAAAGERVLGIRDGTPLILDAGTAILRIDPGRDEIAAARAAIAYRAADRVAAIAAAAERCRMADGTRIEVFANLAGVAEATSAVADGAEGCGLLRSEFLFMDRAAPPDEEEQRAAYQAIADALAGRPLIIRTLDIGGDKPVAYLPMPREGNPALGLRGVRTSLWRPDLLRAQLRAILRVTPVGACRIMVPMVTSVSELAAVRAILDEERLALDVTARIELGVMIETPAAAVTAAVLAVEADFFSIGANDLTQYALAMDRTNPLVAAQVDALHPAVLRLIALACEGASACERPVAVCGALASEPLAAALLIGLGVTELSAAPSVIPHLKAAIRALDMAGCRGLAAQALAQTSPAAVRALLSKEATP